MGDSKITDHEMHVVPCFQFFIYVFGLLYKARCFCPFKFYCCKVNPCKTPKVRDLKLRLHSAVFAYHRRLCSNVKLIFWCS